MFDFESYFESLQDKDLLGDPNEWDTKDKVIMAGVCGSIIYTGYRIQKGLRWLWRNNNSRHR